jgi:hypothetical protein
MLICAFNASIFNCRLKLLGLSASFALRLLPGNSLVIVWLFRKFYPMKKILFLTFFFNYLTKAVRQADSYECCRKQHYLIEEKKAVLRPWKYGEGSDILKISCVFHSSNSTKVKAKKYPSRKK